MAFAAASSFLPIHDDLEEEHIEDVGVATVIPEIVEESHNERKNTCQIEF